MLAVDTDAFVRTYNSRAYIFIYGKVLYAFTPENDDVFLDYAHRIYLSEEAVIFIYYDLMKAVASS